MLARIEHWRATASRVLWARVVLVSVLMAHVDGWIIGSIRTINTVGGGSLDDLPGGEQVDALLQVGESSLRVLELQRAVRRLAELHARADLFVGERRVRLERQVQNLRAEGRARAALRQSRARTGARGPGRRLVRRRTRVQVRVRLRVRLLVGRRRGVRVGGGKKWRRLVRRLSGRRRRLEALRADGGPGIGSTRAGAGSGTNSWTAEMQSGEFRELLGALLLHRARLWRDALARALLDVDCLPLGVALALRNLREQ